MTRHQLCQPIYNKYNELTVAMQGNDLELIKSQALELHSMVHPAAVSNCNSKTIVDHWRFECFDRKAYSLAETGKLITNRL